MKDEDTARDAMRAALDTIIAELPEGKLRNTAWKALDIEIAAMPEVYDLQASYARGRKAIEEAGS